MPEIGTTTGDVLFVDQKLTPFNSHSVQLLIQDIMVCSRDLNIIKEKNKQVKQKLQNMIDVLGRI